MTASSPIPVVLVGCGAVSQQFYLPTLRVLAAAGELSVHTLVDPSAKARQLLGHAFPSAAQAEAIQNVSAPADSLAIVASPPRFHAAQTIECFQRGWHVLCEKPMASDVRECEQMIAAAKPAQRLLAVGLYKRFFPSSHYIKSLCAHKQLGALKRFTIAEGGPFNWPAASPSFFNKAQSQGGVLADIGVHVLDLLLWWLGDPTSFRYADDAMGGLETNLRLQLSYPSGAEGIIRLSRDWATANEYRFVFERGILSWKVNDANGLTMQLSQAPAVLRSQLLSPQGSDLHGGKGELQASNAQSFIAQLQNVLAAIRGTEPLLVTGEEGMRSLKLIEACYREKTLLDQPWLTPSEAQRARQIATQP